MKAIFQRLTTESEEGFAFKAIRSSGFDCPYHQDHTFTCFAYPTYEPHHCEQIGEALVKVIKAYSK